MNGMPVQVAGGRVASSYRDDGTEVVLTVSARDAGYSPLTEGQLMALATSAEPTLYPADS